MFTACFSTPWVRLSIGLIAAANLGVCQTLEAAATATVASRWQPYEAGQWPRPEGAPSDPALGEPTADGENGAEERPRRETLLGERWHTVGPVTSTFLYSGEVFTNTHGGISTRDATRYRGLAELTLMLNTQRAGWWEGGEFQAYLFQSHGMTLTPHFVDDGQYYSNLDTGPKAQDLMEFSEYWYQQTLADGRLSVRIGCQDPSEDMALTNTARNFFNSAFRTLPNIPMPFWPFETLGVSARYRGDERLKLSGGAFDQGKDAHQWWTTQTSRGWFFLGQAELQPFPEAEKPARSLLRGGWWYCTSDTLAVNGSRDYENNYGLYATLDQRLFRERDTEDQGLEAFGEFSWAPPDRNQVDRCWGGGLVYRGLLPTRDADSIGAGFSLIVFSPEQRARTGATYENAVELYYRLRLNTWSTLQPDLQYIAHPNGIRRDALLVGLRWEAKL